MGRFYFGDDTRFFGTGEIGTLTLDDEFTDGISNARILRPAAEELSFECDVDSSVFSKMIGGVDLASREDITGYTLIGKCPRRVQVRRHKKKRINKKWAKRYGYKTVYEDVRITDVRFNHDDSSFEWDVVGSKREWFI